MLLEALGAGEPDLEELLDALEELHVVGAVVLGVRHPLSLSRRRSRGYGPRSRNCENGTRGSSNSRLAPSLSSLCRGSTER